MSKCCREEREVREAHEKEERELQLLMEIEDKQRKQQEYAAEQVRKVKVSVVCCFLFMLSFRNQVYGVCVMPVNFLRSLIWPISAQLMQLKAKRIQKVREREPLGSGYLCS